MDIALYVICGMVASFLLCIGTILFYLKYRKNILQKLYLMKAAELQHQKELLNTIISSQEKERKRIGMDLHDQVGATLSALRLMVDHNEDAVADKFQQSIREQIDAIITSVRNISHDLSPRIKGDYGFADSLQDFCDGINRSGKIKIHISFDNAQAETFLKDDKAMAVYRVLGELINNTIKHAQAACVKILFKFEAGDFVIDYQDDGVGLSATEDKKGIGFQNIESRLSMINARYEIAEVPRGFRMLIRLQAN